jgi:hypothetical protein
VTLTEKLEEECQNFLALALDAELPRPDAKLSVRDARACAEGLMRCLDAEEVQQQLLRDTAGARAFWRAMNLVAAKVRAEKIRPSLPPISATGPLAVLACTVLEHCETLA